VLCGARACVTYEREKTRLYVSLLLRCTFEGNKKTHDDRTTCSWFWWIHVSRRLILVCLLTFGRLLNLELKIVELGLSTFIL